MMQFRIFLISLVFGLVAAPVLAQTDEDRAAFKAAYARFNTAIENQDIATAVDAAGEALDLGTKIYAKDSPSLVQLYFNYGYALADSGQGQAAIEPLKQGIRKSEELYGKDSEQLMAPLWTLARIHEKYDDREEKKQILFRVRSLIEASEGDQSHAFGQINLDIGVALAMSGERGGEEYFQRAYDLFNSLYDGKAYQIGVAALWLGKLDFARRKWEKAEPRFIEALSIFEETTPPGREFDIGAHSFLVRLYERTGESDKATQHCQAIPRIRPQAYVDGYFPIYKKPPSYPIGAQSNGREGQVLLEFTVTKEGSVRDVEVVQSEGGKSFEKAAIKAAADFRYAPAVKDGELIETPGVRNLITFKLAR